MHICTGQDDKAVLLYVGANYICFAYEHQQISCLRLVATWLVSKRGVSMRSTGDHILESRSVLSDGSTYLSCSYHNLEEVSVASSNLLKTKFRLCLI